MRTILSTALAGTMMNTLLTLSATASPSATQPVHAGSRMIGNEHLAIELMDPASEERYHRGVRFTPVAAVIRANCDGHEFLFRKLKPDPQTDVAGLFAEFDLNTEPPGFTEAKADEPFIKIGVGVLRKEEGRYRFYIPYALAQRPITDVRWEADTAEFRQSLPPVSGYGYTLSARAHVAGRTLTIDWNLSNTGTKPFRTAQYLHNSFQFDGLAVGPDYSLAFPFDFTLKKAAAPQRQEDRQVRFDGPLPKPLNSEVDYPPGYDGANSVIVRHRNGMQIDCETSVPGSRVAIHAATTYLCPEQFIELDLAPGQTRSWKRIYTFRTPDQDLFDRPRR